MLIEYHPPALRDRDQVEELAKITADLHKKRIMMLAMESLDSGHPSKEISIDSAISLARSRDHESMYERREESGSHTDQSMTAALAAYVIRFEHPSVDVRNWALSVLDRIENMKEQPGVFWAEKKPVAPDSIRYSYSEIPS